jgi:hypothetical protein
MHHVFSFYRIVSISFLIIISSLVITIQFPLALAGVNTGDQDGDGYYYDPPSGMLGDPDDQDPCTPDENSKPCIEIKNDPIGAVNDVMNTVNNLISSGDFDINSAQTKALLAKLKNAISNIESDKINVAINNLNAFNNQINAYINAGQILPKDGQELILQVNNIINSL